MDNKMDDAQKRIEEELTRISEKCDRIELKCEEVGAVRLSPFVQYTAISLPSFPLQISEESRHFSNDYRYAPSIIQLDLTFLTKMY